MTWNLYLRSWSCLSDDLGRTAQLLVSQMEGLCRCCLPSTSSPSVLHPSSPPVVNWQRQLGLQSCRPSTFPPIRSTLHWMLLRDSSLITQWVSSTGDLSSALNSVSNRSLSSVYSGYFHTGDWMLPFISFLLRHTLLCFHTASPRLFFSVPTCSDIVILCIFICPYVAKYKP